MRTELKRLHQMLKTTVVYVTHDQIEAMTLATRIAVMRNGRIEQLATPEEVYDRPATLYVAGFVGSPPMNILDAEVTARGLKLDGCEEVLPLPAAFNGAASAGRRVKVGIRPEALRLAAGSEARRLTAHVEVVELTGPELVTTATVGRQRITACLPPRTAVGMGSAHAFTFDETALHLFDPESGRSLRME
jgi:multiple sugar transport system ATP-binding protein